MLAAMELFTRFNNIHLGTCSRYNDASPSAHHLVKITDSFYGFCETAINFMSI